MTMYRTGASTQRTGAASRAEQAVQRGLERSGRGIVIGIPTVWLLVFFVAPLLVVLLISVSEPAIRQPPYLPIAAYEGDTLTLNISLRSYLFFLRDNLYVNAYLESVTIAGVSTLIALLLGYPMAYTIARAGGPWRQGLLLLVMVPFWTSLLLRVYAWIGILKPDGLLNSALIGLGLITEPLIILRTDLAVYIGIVYTYLPFMVLPLYATLHKLDGLLLEASSDLGARPLTTFLTVTLPLSLPGMLAGCLLVFVPAVGEYVIPELLGGPDTLMIGRVLWNEFASNRDWPVASAVAMAMLVLVVVPVMLLRNLAGQQAGPR